ncbi:Uncharacterised protein [Mycobacteroides abscessus subsp. abscessus]|nr:Uncharacterised protein [Mycobacteroides abscessus subsp. abscessus]
MPIRPLGVHDRHVRVQRGHGGEPFPGEGAGDRFDRVGHLGQVGADVAAQHRERQAGGAGDVAVGHARVAVLLDLERHRPAVLHRVAEPVQRADAGVAAPGEHQLARAARADELVVDQIGGHPHQRQVAAALPDDLPPGRHRNQVGEALERDGVAVVHEVGDRVRQRRYIGHEPSPVRIVNICSHYEHWARHRQPSRIDHSHVSIGPEIVFVLTQYLSLP